MTGTHWVELGAWLFLVMLGLAIYGRLAVVVVNQNLIGNEVMLSRSILQKMVQEGWRLTMVNEDHGPLH